jgi:hypothetical protein
MHNPHSGEEILIRNSLQSRAPPTGSSFPHLLGNIENEKSEKKFFFGIWSGSARRNLLLAFGSTLGYLEKTPAVEVSDGSTCTQWTIPGNRTGSSGHPHMAKRPSLERPSTKRATLTKPMLTGFPCSNNLCNLCIMLTIRKGPDFPLIKETAWRRFSTN